MIRRVCRLVIALAVLAPCLLAQSVDEIGQGFFVTGGCIQLCASESTQVLRLAKNASLGSTRDWAMLMARSQS